MTPSPPNQADGALDSPEEFLAAWIEALRQAGHSETFEPAGSLTLVRFRDGRRCGEFRGLRAYQSYLQAPEERDHHLTYLVDMVHSIDDTSTHCPDLTRLVPVIRTYEALVGLGMARVPSQKLVDDIYVHLVEDHREHFRYLRPRDLETTGRTFDELLEQAIQNLRQIAPAKEDDLGHGCVMMISGGDYESSLILDRALIDAYAQRLGGDVDVSIPLPDVFVMSPKSRQGIELQARVISSAFNQPERLISPKVFSYRQGQLVPVAHVSLDEQEQIRLSFISQDAS